MYTKEALLDMHTRTHAVLKKLLAHCRSLTAEELNREIAGFGYPTVRLQFHHEIGAEEYWIGVLRSNFSVEDNESEFTTVESLEAYREQVCRVTEEYLGSASTDELNTRRSMMTFGNNERHLVPAHVVVRTMTHLFQHQGEITSMCRLIGKRVAGTDFPLN